MRAIEIDTKRGRLLARLDAKCAKAREAKARSDARRQRFAVTYRVGPMLHWRIGAVGGSLYLAQRDRRYAGMVRQWIAARAAALAIGALLAGSAL